MKIFSNAPIKGYNEEDIKVPMGDEGTSTEFRHVLRMILNNAPFQTQDDSIQGNRLATSIDKAEGKETIEMEDGVHDWLKKVSDKVTPPVFRINGNIVYEYIREGFEKPHQPNDKRGKQTPEDKN